MDRLDGAGRNRGRVSAQELIEETEAFFAGHYLEATGASDLGTPTWARLNRLTHAAPGEICEWSRAGFGPQPSPGSWPWAVELLSKEMTALSQGDEAVIFDLQRDCLIPVELTLMGWSHHSVLPADLVALCIPCLREHPHVRRHRHSETPPGVRR